MNFDQAPKQESVENVYPNNLSDSQKKEREEYLELCKAGRFEEVADQLVEERSFAEQDILDDELGREGRDRINAQLDFIANLLTEMIRLEREGKEYPENLIQEEKDEREDYLAQYKHDGYDATMRNLDISIDEAESRYSKLDNKSGDRAEEMAFRVDFFKSIKKEIEELENNK